ncbi:DUF695 domain-containing protein [Flavobacterium sp. I3-2]|uniref:DUF695 domain-containing protein n=1 Tax=Flavobacterium sp. I3-2 TaxID=2748319 RepID=UPI0015AE38CC|nr:DUF695 domain-containing protein [Flavobacterium sp. I3-2]
MDILKTLLNENQKLYDNQAYENFWNWFIKNESTFFETVKSRENIESDFFELLSPELNKINEGIYFLTGMFNENKAELILTPDGILKNFFFIEELIKKAPELPNWKFTALKQPNEIDNIGIKMGDYTFDSETLSFYPIEHPAYPDEVELVVVHNDFKEEDKRQIGNGTFIFLDNFLGELNSVTTIDYLTVTSKDKAEKELIPIEKLKDYLIWREKEFIEKYHGIRYNTENDNYSSLKATLENGLPLIAIVNSTLLNWDSKASHPWILKITIKYDGSENNGFPEEDTYQLMDVFEDEINLELKDFEGYLNIGRETADGERIVFFACNDFRKPSKVLNNLTKKFSDKLDVSYDIYKDKYWRSLEQYRPN